jgi:predicted amidohydrolase YtcJ
MERPGALADWMVAEGGVVVSTGRGPAPDAARDGASLLDLSGLAVVPALHDTHVHLLGTGQMEIDLDLGGASSFAEALDLVADGARGFRGSVLRAHSFDPDLMEGGRYLTSADLDAVSSTLPIHVRRRDGHSSSANGAALALFGTRPGDAGAEVDAAGRLTGVLRGKAHGDAAARAGDLLAPEERAECYRRAAARAVSRGVGVVHALVGREEDAACRDAELLLGVMPELPIDVVVFAQTTDVDRVAALGLPRIGGCVLLDGSFGSRTAALTEPYADSPGGGELYRSDDELTGFFRAAHARGLQIAVHAIGDRAIGQAAACYRAACGEDAAGARHRIEHCEIPSPAHVAAMSRLGLASGVQPAFELYWGGPGGMYEARLGPRRASRTNPLRTMLESGVAIAGGSDSYVTPMDPLLGVHAAVNRAAPDERLSVHDALSLFTSRAAWISFDERRRGTLEPGKEASFTVLGADPFTVDPATLRDIPVVGLFVRGRPVSGPFASGPRGV